MISPVVIQRFPSISVFNEVEAGTPFDTQFAWNVTLLVDLVIKT